MRRALPFLILLVGCASCASVEQTTPPPRVSNARRYHFVHGDASIDLEQTGSAEWTVTSGEPTREELERASLELDAVIAHRGQSYEHHLRRAVREAARAEGEGDVLLLVPTIMGDECPDPKTRARYLDLLASRPALSPDAQVVLARAAIALDDASSGMTLATVVMRPDASEAVLELALRVARRLDPRAARVVLYRAVTRGLRAHFLEATRALGSSEERAPLLEAFAKAPVDANEQLALVKEAATLESAAAKRVLLALLANADASDEALAACADVVPTLASSANQVDVVSALIATGRPAAITAAIHVARETDGRWISQTMCSNVARAVIAAACAQKSVPEAAQLELASIALDLVAARETFREAENDRLLLRLARQPWAKTQTRALIVAKAPGELATDLLEVVSLENDAQAIALVESALASNRRGACELLEALLAKRDTPAVREKIRGAIDDLPEGPARDRLWRALIENAHEH